MGCLSFEFLVMGTNCEPLIKFSVCKMWICWREFPNICFPLCRGKAIASVWRITHGTTSQGL